MSEAGRNRRRRAQGPRADRLNDRVVQLDAKLAEWTDDFVFGEVWGRAGLSHEERMLVAVTALAMRGEQGLLRNYLFGALHDGIPAYKLREAIVMLCVYGGFPTAIAGMVTLEEVVASAQRQGLEVQAHPPA